MVNLARKVTGLRAEPTTDALLNGHEVKLLLNIYVYTNGPVLFSAQAREASFVVGKG